MQQNWPIDIPQNPKPTVKTFQTLAVFLERCDFDQIHYLLVSHWAIYKLKYKMFLDCKLEEENEIQICCCQIYVDTTIFMKKSMPFSMLNSKLRWSYRCQLSYFRKLNRLHVFSKPADHQLLALLIYKLHHLGWDSIIRTVNKLSHSSEKTPKSITKAPTCNLSTWKMLPQTTKPQDHNIQRL